MTQEAVLQFLPSFKIEIEFIGVTLVNEPKDFRCAVV